MVRRDPHFEREHHGSELEIKSEMEHRLMAYFATKHGTEWQWCPTCRVWSPPHEHRAVSNG